MVEGLLAGVRDILWIPITQVGWKGRCKGKGWVKRALGQGLASSPPHSTQLNMT